ncbi:hypothetical protein [Streptomyces sp. BE230]|uniref:hypothetical protein n=1 Tax=Streptomyces sp. BE230 TaxID=3002526 RepID=UPI002ED2AC37|nr:hypothetical protein [Streptomyces sp. BE230]
MFLGLAVGCTSESDGPGGPAGPHASTSSPATPRPNPSDAGAHVEKQLGKQAQEALGTVDISDDPGFVEAGLERVGDGFHSVPDLPPGKAYELAVVCTGSGRITLSIASKTPVRRTLDCDGVPFRQPLTAPDGKLRIDAAALPGATGMVAWRVDRAAQ